MICHKTEHLQIVCVWREAFAGRVDNQSTKALLTSSGTSSCGQCPACKFTRVVFGYNSLIRDAFAGPTQGSKSPQSNSSGQVSMLKKLSRVYSVWFNMNRVINLWIIDRISSGIKTNVQTRKRGII